MNLLSLVAPRQAPTDLCFCRMRADFRVERDLELPSYTGSTFRGALGHALRRVRAGRDPLNCRRCSILPECRYMNLYDYLFEAPADHPIIAATSLPVEIKADRYPQPFVLSPPPGGSYAVGESLSLWLTVVGLAAGCLPFLECGMRRLAEGRLGKGEGAVRLEAVGLEPIVLFDPGGSEEFGNPEVGVPPPLEAADFHAVRDALQRRFGESQSDAPHRVRILFDTPFRFKDGNRLGTSLDFKTFMRNVLRRITLLSIHSPLSFQIDFRRLLNDAESVRTRSSSLHWLDWERYSARQKTRMTFGGLVGEIVFDGVPGEFLPYVKICEFLNVGKNAAFGLGRFRAVID